MRSRPISRVLSALARRGSHSSRRSVTATFKQPTRRLGGPPHRLPIWSCSRWGLPCRSVTRLAVRSYRTISPLPACLRRLRRYLSVALSVGSRRPGVTWHRALWSPDFPRHPERMTRLPGRLRRGHLTCFIRSTRNPKACRKAGVHSPPYNALRGAPDSSAASFAAVEGGRWSLSLAYRRRPSTTLASAASPAPCTSTTNSPLR